MTLVGEPLREAADARVRNDDRPSEPYQDKSGPCPIKTGIQLALFEFVAWIHVMAQFGSSRKRVRHVHLRPREDQYAILVSVARHRDLPLATAILQMAEEGIAAWRRGQSQTSNELAIHQLIAIEQVIALLESFMPRRRGAAWRLLEKATEAAHMRLSADQDATEEPDGAGSPAPPPRRQTAS